MNSGVISNVSSSECLGGDRHHTRSDQKFPKTRTGDYDRLGPILTLNRKSLLKKHRQPTDILWDEVNWPHQTLGACVIDSSDRHPVKGVFGGPETNIYMEFD